jgi:hypothetical protein
LPRELHSRRHTGERCRLLTSTTSFSATLNVVMAPFSQPTHSSFLDGCHASEVGWAVLGEGRSSPVILSP